MKKSTVLAAVVALALPLCSAAIAAENHENHQAPPGTHKRADKRDISVVHGTITKIDGQTLTVDGKEVKFSDKTQIAQDKQPATADALKVGQKITARIKEGVAIRIEIAAQHADEKEHSESK